MAPEGFDREDLRCVSRLLTATGVSALTTALLLYLYPPDIGVFWLEATGLTLLGLALYVFCVVLPEIWRNEP